MSPLAEGTLPRGDPLADGMGTPSRGADPNLAFPLGGKPRKKGGTASKDALGKQFDSSATAIGKTIGPRLEIAFRTGRLSSENHVSPANALFGNMGILPHPTNWRGSAVVRRRPRFPPPLARGRFPSADAGLRPRRPGPVRRGYPWSPTSFPMDRRGQGAPQSPSGRSEPRRRPSDVPGNRRRATAIPQPVQTPSSAPFTRPMAS